MVVTRARWYMNNRLKKDNLLQSSVVQWFAIKDLQRSCCGYSVTSFVYVYLWALVARGKFEDVIYVFEYIRAAYKGTCV